MERSRWLGGLDTRPVYHSPTTGGTAVATTEKTTTEDSALVSIDTSTPEGAKALRQVTEQLSLMDFDSLWAESADGAEFFGSGWDLIDKSKLIDTPFVIVGFRYNDGNFGTFVSVQVIDKDNRHLVFNDGSTGVCQQIIDADHQGLKLPLRVKGGLRVSEYTFHDPKTGTEIPATTYYLQA
jgi:hypothetical protein